MKRPAIILSVATLVILCLVGFYFVSKEENKPLRSLPFFDPKDFTKEKRKVHHVVPPFSFMNQYGKTVTEKNTAGKVYVCDYFFTTCRSICPVMSNQLVKVYKKFNARNDFLILSHTVDPQTDTVAQLLNYAKQHGVNDERWLFLTGDKKQLYSLARKGYLLSVDEGDGGAEDFIHTQNFALIDKERHIRGFYDGTDSLEVTRPINDLELLFAAYDYEEKK